MFTKSHFCRSLPLSLIWANPFRFTHKSIEKKPVKVQPVKLAYEVFKNKRDVKPTIPLIIMHGLFGNKKNWTDVALGINELTNRKVICVDCRNHGESPFTQEHSYDHMTEDIRYFMEEMKIQKASFLGHSLGGLAMVHFALKYPKSVEKLIVADTSPVTVTPNPRLVKTIINAMEKVEFPKDVSFSEAKSIINHQLVRNQVDGVDIREFLLTNISQKNGSYTWSANITAIRDNFLKIAVFPNFHMKFNGPVLFVGGEKSNYIPVDDRSAILRIFPEAHITYIADAGHWIFLDKPREFTDICSKFLQKQEDNNS